MTIASCIHERVAVQAAARPDSIALVCEGRSIRYGELERQANRLAHRLRALGVGPEERVGLCMERKSELVVAMLAVLKAGGAYVPVDPTHPRERLAMILEDAEPRVVLTDRHSAEALPRGITSALCVEDLGDGPDEPLTSGVGPDNLAYVIYTSGSTGRPKGVLITHQNVVRLFDQTHPWFGFDERDVWTFFHSAAFDFSVWEIWGALFYGGRLVVVPHRLARSPDEMRALLSREQVTVLNQTPSAFRQLIRADEATRSPLALRLVIFGGEALELQSLRGWFQRHGDQRPQLVNMYGITETTVHVTYRPLTRKDVSAKGSLIGGPIPDLELHLLDEHGHAVRDGEIGEMYVGGEGVARGYLKRPELTEQRFVAHPLAGPGKRLYRSGDLARRLANGDLEYLGRMDHQVKIRGFRIELGEIESQLARHEEIREVVVLAREDRPGEKRLVAYLVAAKRPSVSALRAALSERLPDYMVPSAFVFVERMPLTGNGKVDRAALPAPAGERPELNTPFRPPANALEGAIVDAWAEILHLDRVGADDDFFALGGDSLAAAVSLARIAPPALRLPATLVFDEPTPARLALAVRERMAREQTEPAASTLRRPPSTERKPLSFAQRWYACQERPVSPAFTIASTFRFSGRFDRGALGRTIEEITRRHETVRARFTLGEAPAQSMGASCAMSESDVSDEVDTEAAFALHASEIVRRPFDLVQGPLFRAELVRMGESEHRLVVAAHHLVWDGWSDGVLQNEIKTLYPAFAAGQGSPLPPVPLQQADFAEHQEAALKSGALDETVGYWRSELAGEPGCFHPLATDAAVSQSYFRPRRHSVVVAPQTIQSLQSLAREERASLFFVLLAAFQSLVRRTSGRDEFAVASAHANRDRPELEDAIGNYAQIWSWRSRLSADLTFRRLVQRVRREADAKYAHPDYPPDLALGRPRFAMPWQIAFNYFNYSHPLALPGLDVSWTPLPLEQTSFALHCMLARRSEDLLVVWQYAAEIFSDATIQQLATRYSALLERVAGDPDARLNSL